MRVLLFTMLTFCFFAAVALSQLADAENIPMPARPLGGGESLCVSKFAKSAVVVPSRFAAKYGDTRNELKFTARTPPAIDDTTPKRQLITCVDSQAVTTDGVRARLRRSRTRCLCDCSSDRLSTTGTRRIVRRFAARRALRQIE